MTNRFLDPANNDDVNQLSDILNDYLKSESERVSPIYDIEYLIRLVTWIQETFKTAPQSDFIITGKFIDGRLEQIFVAYKLEVLWKVKEDLWPYWLVGLVYFRNAEWATPAEKILSIEALSTEHFESQQRTTGFMVIKAPTGLLNLKNYANIDNYINTVFTKTIPGITHDFRVEQIFRSQEDINRYKFKAFKSILPTYILKPIVLLSFTLKHEHRLAR
jgi:hypothetical protein